MHLLLISLLWSITASALPAELHSVQPSDQADSSSNEHLVRPREINAGLPSGLDVHAYLGPYCTGGVVITKDVVYGEQIVLSEGMQSYRFDRDLYEGEQIDFSMYPSGLVRGRGRLHRRGDGSINSNTTTSNNASLDPATTPTPKNNTNTNNNLLNTIQTAHLSSKNPASAIITEKLDNPLVRRGAKNTGPPQACSLFYMSGQPLQKVGCYTLFATVNCYELWHH